MNMNVKSVRMSEFYLQGPILSTTDIITLFNRLNWHEKISTDL
jgi:hypothetical protein